ncbi:DNA circularization N-terminal domain-containing protein [Limnobaculum xujianqingii]|uniref:DNA circularization N-terminal domain-containing protein n=1 Tax=Limnobaculum xujianqingii TaxID=2738837 RepID=UPI001E65BCEA|nr:DNA circularization N-terminal domain-containing protein [Limnobaculum xujianqingii]
MAWSEYMLDASFRGVRFDVIQTRDSVSRSVAVHEYPYQDGGDVEDLGRQPRNSRMTALFWGDTYEQQLQAFIVALDTYGSAELIHPIFGSMPNMQCIEYGIDHTADNVDHCYVELVFLEATPATRFLCKSSLCQNWTKYAIKFRGYLMGCKVF